MEFSVRPGSKFVKSHQRFPNNFCASNKIRLSEAVQSPRNVNAKCVFITAKQRKHHLLLEISMIGQYNAHLPRLMLGSKWLNQRSRHCFPRRPKQPYDFKSTQCKISVFTMKLFSYNTPLYFAVTVKHYFSTENGIFILPPCTLLYTRFQHFAVSV